MTNQKTPEQGGAKLAQNSGATEEQIEAAARAILREQYGNASDHLDWHRNWRTSKWLTAERYARAALSAPSGTHPADERHDAEQREAESEDHAGVSEQDEELDDCPACDAHLSDCSPDAACCGDCDHGPNFAPRSEDHAATDAPRAITEEQRAKLNAELTSLRHVRDTMRAVAQSLRGGYASDSGAAYYMRQIETALEATPEPVPRDEREKLIAEALEEVSLRATADSYYGTETDEEAEAKAQGFNAAMEIVEPYVQGLAAPVEVGVRRVEFLLIGHPGWPDPLVTESEEEARDWFREYRSIHSVRVDRRVTYRVDEWLGGEGR